MSKKLQAKVRPTLEVGKSYGGLPFKISMARFKGQTITVQEVKDGRFSCYEQVGQENDFYSREMLIIYQEVEALTFFNVEKLIEHIMDDNVLLFPFSSAGLRSADGFRVYLYYIYPDLPALEIYYTDKKDYYRLRRMKDAKNGVLQRGPSNG
jgi:hypothetical protein